MNWEEDGRKKWNEHKSGGKREESKMVREKRDKKE